MPENKNKYLLGDIGGTYARFAVSDGLRFSKESVYECRDYNDPAVAIRQYLDSIDQKSRPETAVFCVAGPVKSDEIDVINNHWNFSQKALKDSLSLERLHCLNDFEALALAIPEMDESSIKSLDADDNKRKEKNPSYPLVVIGPGTGLGTAILKPVSSVSGLTYLTIAGEGGHVDIPINSKEEFDIVSLVKEEKEFCDAETLCSGPGLETLHKAIARYKENENHNSAGRLQASEISQKAIENSCPICVETMHFMFRTLGRVSGNLALTANAFGGVYLAGGVIKKLEDNIHIFADSFRRGFTDKGRYGSYLKDIPIFTVNHPFPAFIGLQAYLRSE